MASLNQNYLIFFFQARTTMSTPSIPPVHRRLGVANEWDVEDEGEVSDLLSVEVNSEGKYVVLRQRNYIEKLLATFDPDGVPISPFGAARTL